MKPLPSIRAAAVFAVVACAAASAFAQAGGTAQERFERIIRSHAEFSNLSAQDVSKLTLKVSPKGLVVVLAPAEKSASGQITKAEKTVVIPNDEFKAANLRPMSSLDEHNQKQVSIDEVGQGGSSLDHKKTLETSKSLIREMSLQRMAGDASQKAGTKATAESQGLGSSESAGDVPSSGGVKGSYGGTRDAVAVADEANKNKPKSNYSMKGTDGINVPAPGTASPAKTEDVAENKTPSDPGAAPAVAAAAPPHGEARDASPWMNRLKAAIGITPVTKSADDADKIPLN